MWVFQLNGIVTSTTFCALVSPSRFIPTRGTLPHNIAIGKKAIILFRKKLRSDPLFNVTVFKQIQKEWDHAAKNIPSESLEFFKRVAETYDGEALAVVEQQDEKAGTYSCGGCFMSIAAENVNLLMTKDDIIRCPNCTRILVLSNAQS